MRRNLINISLQKNPAPFLFRILEERLLVEGGRKHQSRQHAPWEWGKKTRTRKRWQGQKTRTGFPRSWERKKMTRRVSIKYLRMLRLLSIKHLNRTRVQLLRGLVTRADSLEIWMIWLFDDYVKPQVADMLVLLLSMMPVDSLLITS